MLSPRWPLLFLLLPALGCERAVVGVDDVGTVETTPAAPGEEIVSDTGSIGAPDVSEQPDRPDSGDAEGDDTESSSTDSGKPPGDSGLYDSGLPGDSASGDDTAGGGDTAAGGDTDSGGWVDTAGGGGPVGLPELCNGVDDDLDGTVDEEALDATTWYADGDGDGYGDPAAATLACTVPAGFVADGTDCDDTAADSRPGAAEHCDGADNDCDGTVDELAVDAIAWYPDGDNDGYGSAAGEVWSCEAPAGYNANATDCNDADATVSPVAAESCNSVDDDCDGNIDEEPVDAVVLYVDLDGDGFGGEAAPPACETTDPGLVFESGDCDDELAWVYPDAAEFCDGIDSNCDADADAGAVDAPVWYQDLDGDAYGDSAVALTQCDNPGGWSADASDCDDTDSARAPGLVEVCNGVDDDCSGVADDNGGECDSGGGGTDTGVGSDTADGGGGPPSDTADTGVTVEPSPCDGELWYADLDADGWGDDADTFAGCQPDASWVDQGGDCDDSDPDLSPGATELCNDVDDNCDGTVDNSPADDSVWYGDTDGDGVGSASTFRWACSQPVGFVANEGDCDDSDPAVFPGAVETCDGIDNDCNEGADETSAVDALSWFVDRDGDTHAGISTRSACTQPSNGYPTADDCDDDNSDTYPGAAEVCNDVDDDCNGLVDDGTSIGARYLYADTDSDGYGDPATATWSCSSIAGYVTKGTDCNDLEAAVAPGRAERCDGFDNNCDGSVDEEGASGERTWYADVDGDGVGTGASTVRACSQPAGFASSAGDCDDADAAAFPGATEVCGDGVDNDCDGVASLCGVWGEHPIADSDSWYIGSAPGDDAGRSVGFVGDVNGDGTQDWAVGSSSNNEGTTDAGAVLVFSGGAFGAESTGSALATVYGLAASDFVGWSMGPAGDVDGDGADDLVVSAYGSDTASVDAGAVYLLAGGLSGNEDVRGARLTVFGDTTLDLAGYSVSAGVDVTGDGVGDIAIGAPYQDAGGNRAGAAYLVDGTDTGMMTTASSEAMRTGEVALDRAGTALALVGDLDGDGFGDLMVGAWGDSTVGTRSGAVYCEYGPITGTASLAAADAKWLGERGSDRAGLAVAGAGDVDGDGLDDALVGAPYGTSAYLVGANVGVASLSTATAIFRQEDAGGRMGSSVAGGGDVDADGFADVLIGAPYSSAYVAMAGSAYLVRGPLSGTVLLEGADGLLRGEVVSDFVGTSVANGGDSDGDGFDDVLIGAVGRDDGGSAAGGAWLFYGSTP